MRPSLGTDLIRKLISQKDRALRQALRFWLRDRSEAENEAMQTEAQLKELEALEELGEFRQLESESLEEKAESEGHLARIVSYLEPLTQPLRVPAEKLEEGTAALLRRLRSARQELRWRRRGAPENGETQNPSSGNEFYEPGTAMAEAQDELLTQETEPNEDGLCFGQNLSLCADEITVSFYDDLAKPRPARNTIDPSLIAKNLQNKNPWRLMSPEVFERFEMKEMARRFDELAMKLAQEREVPALYDAIQAFDELERELAELRLELELLDSFCKDPSIKGSDAIDSADQDLIQSLKLELDRFDAQKSLKAKQVLLELDDAHLSRLAARVGVGYFYRLQQDCALFKVQDEGQMRGETAAIAQIEQTLASLTSVTQTSKAESAQSERQQVRRLMKDVIALVKERQALALRLGYSDYAVLCHELNGLHDLSFEDASRARYALAKYFPEVYQKLKEHRTHKREKIDEQSEHRYNWEWSEPTSPRPLPFDLGSLAPITEDMEALLLDVMNLLYRALRPMTHPKTEAEQNHLGQAQAQRRHFLDNYPQSLLQEDRIVMTEQADLLKERQDWPLSREDALHYRRSSVQQVQKPALRSPLIFGQKPKHATDLWDWIKASGEAYFSTAMVDIENLLVMEQSERISRTFTGYAFEMLCMREIANAEAMRTSYLERLKLRAMNHETQDQSYGRFQARQALDRLHDDALLWAKERIERRRFIDRRMMELLEQMLFYAMLDALEIELYRADKKLDSDRFIHLWRELNARYFPQGSRFVRIRDEEVLRRLVYQPFSSFEAWLSIYAALIFWDEAGRDYERAAKRLKRFCDLPARVSFTERLRCFDIDDLAHEDEAKRLRFQLAFAMEC